MTLCMAHMVHTMAHTGSSNTAFGVSVNDIQHWGEQERLESGRQSRMQALDEILDSTFYRTASRRSSSSGLSRPVSASRTLPTVSRPSTVSSARPSRHAADYAVNRVAICSSAPPDLPPGPLTINKCIRSQSARDRTMSSMVGSLARQCCEVLGPPVCSQCAKLKRRDDNMEDSESTFPILHTSGENFSKTVLINSYFPDMTPLQIQTKIARGEIALDSFRKNLQSRRQNKKINAQAIETVNSNKPVRPKSRNTNDQGATDTFFTSIQHLNQKIVSGQMDRKLDSNTKGKQKHGDSVISNGTVPTFVSPRKYRYQQPSYKTFYDPPLLPRASQNPPSSFFAGGNDDYDLPDRLPEVIVFEGGEIASVEALDPPKNISESNDADDTETDLKSTTNS